MGLFDYVRCQYKLPTRLKNAQARTYQTKSLYSALESYEIRADGTLWHEAPHRPWYQLPTFTGEIRFYDVIEQAKRRNREGWIEFTAKFVDGRLKSIEQSRFEKELKEPPAERRKKVGSTRNMKREKIRKWRSHAL
jgi:hypothetical protein